MARTPGPLCPALSKVVLLPSLLPDPESFQRPHLVGTPQTLVEGRHIFKVQFSSLDHDHQINLPTGEVDPAGG